VFLVLCFVCLHSVSPVLCFVCQKTNKT
jgi:hypothetical protein